MVVRTARVGSKMSEGVRALWRELESRGLSQGELGKLLDTKSSVVNRWLHGDSKPGREMATKIKALLGIEPELFDERPRGSIRALRIAS
jgi:ribosome-binding protein aMBF1 (putative translation factor)